MLQRAIDQLSKLSVARPTRDDELVDQLHHYVAVGTLLSLALLVGANAFVGSPINCWVPKEYDKDHFQHYVDNYCWISHLYNVPFTEELPYDLEERMEEERDVSFYRWVMVMFMVQALMFEIPHLIWTTLKPYSGINMEKILTMTAESQLKAPKERDKELSQIAVFMDRWLRTYRRYDSNPLGNVKNKLGSFLFCFGRRSGCYLTRLYLFTKLLYMVNVIAQFEVLTSFLGFNYWTYGAEVIRMLSESERWQDLKHFPRIGMCDFQIRQLQNIQRFTVQCVLSINLFLEKIYAAQWFILLLLAILTGVSLVTWVVEEVMSSKRNRFMTKHLHMFESRGDSVDRRLFRRFSRHYLRDDGIFLLKVIDNNSSEILTFDLVNYLWQRYKKDHHKVDEEYTPDSKPLVNSSNV